MIWLNFLGSNPDGLANIWIAIYTFTDCLDRDLSSCKANSPICLAATTKRTPSTSGPVCRSRSCPCFSFSMLLQRDRPSSRARGRTPLNPFVD